MKIAVAVDGNLVSAHFGHCPAYAIYNADNGQIADKSLVMNPGHQPGFLPGFLGKLGVNCMIAGGMGPHAQDLFAAQGIETIIGVTGDPDAAVAAYLQGNLKGGESTCGHGQAGHAGCGGGHG